jgi:hypothetical protein
MTYRGFTIGHDGKHWVIREGKRCQWFTDTPDEAKDYIDAVLWKRANLPF